MERIRLIQYKGKTILLEDFSNMRPCPEVYKALHSAQEITRSCAPGSVRTLFDATGAAFDMGTVTVLKKFVGGNTPYVKCSAVVGVKGLSRIVLSTLSQAVGRTFHEFDTREEALEFLANQE
jgi:hypothetical protein